MPGPKLTLRLLCVFISTGTLFGQTPTTLSLSTSSPSVALGSPLDLTATVTPSAATGKVTFYDGASVLGVASLTAGQAAVTTVLLPAGTRSLRAHYSGDSTYAASNSSPVSQIVVAGVSLALRHPSYYSTAPGPNAVKVADFNNDGKQDVATANYSGANLSVFLGNGDGSFQAAVNYSVGVPAYSLAVGDFNGDGNADLVVARLSAAVGVLLGNGDGTFQPPVDFSVGASATSIAVGDFNGDGKADLA